MKVHIPDDHAYLVIDSTGKIRMEPPMSAAPDDQVPAAWIYAAAVLAYMDTTRMAEALKPLER